MHNMAEKDSNHGLSDNEAGALRAVTESIKQFGGSFTGKKLEQKIQEYTSVYGEILLGMHNRLNDLERQVKSLRKEVSRQHRQIQSLESKITEKRPRSTLSMIGPLASVLLAISLLLWLLWIHMKN
jgi:predicted RNase H-like nuclease (RuvC/YqgF family)